MRASSFFDGVSQVELGTDENSMRAPLFYYDGEAMVGIFPARLSALKKLMPDARMRPARLAPGIGAVTIACFEYRDTDITDYNELAIAIPLNEPYYRPNLPGRALASALRRDQFDVLVHHLPVTTERARTGGRTWYNYPKFVAGIDFEQDSKLRTCKLSEGVEPILTMTCKRIAANEQREMQLFSHLFMERQPQQSEFKINGIKCGRSLRPGVAKLELGKQHPIALELRKLLISTSSISAAYMPQMEGILYGPEHITAGLIRSIGKTRQPATSDAGER